MKNKVLSLIITLALLLGFIPNLSMAYSENDNEYSDVVEIESNETTEIDGQIYKVFEISNLKVNDLLKSARSYGEFKPMAAGDKLLNWQLQVDWIGRGESEFPFPAGGMEVTLMQTGTSKVFGKVVYTKDKINMSTGIGTPVDFLEVENVNPDELGDSVKLGIPDSVNYDAKVFLEGTPKKGYKISALFKQQVNPLFKSEWHITDADKPSIDAYVIDTNDDTKTMDFYVPKNDNEIYSIYDTPFAKYYDGSSFKPVVTGTDARKSKNENYRGAFGKNNILLGNAAEPSIVFGYGESENHNNTGFVNVNNKKYLLNVFGDHLTIKRYAVYEALKVKFNTGNGKLAVDGETNQDIGNPQEIGYSEKIANNESGRTITLPTDKLVPPANEAGQPANEFKGWALTVDAAKPLFKTQNEANAYTVPFTEDVTTFHAIYGPVAQGKVKVQYLEFVSASQTTQIEDKYKFISADASKDLDKKGNKLTLATKYPVEKTGNKGETIEQAVLQTNAAPTFIGYKIKQVKTYPVPSQPGDTAKYTENGDYTIQYVYDKLDDIVGPIGTTDEFPEGYVAVKFFADESSQDRGEFAGSKTALVYGVNPINAEIDTANKKLSGMKKDGTAQNVDFPSYSVKQASQATWKTNDTTPWVMSPDNAIKADKKIDVDKLGTNKDLTFTAQYVKQKGTVTYKYNENVNTTQVQNPSTADIPAAPTDDTQYDVGTEVAAETNVAEANKVTGKTIQVKNNSGTVIGQWTFGGWQPNKLTIKKNSQTDKNEFTGTWTFTEAGKKSVTYEFASGTNGETLPQDVTSLLTKQAESKYVNETVNAPTDTYNAVEISTSKKQGTWTFDGWYAGTVDAAKKGQALTVTEAGPNKFIGVWKFAEKGKKNVTFEFAFYNSKGNKAILNNAIGQFKPTLPPSQDNKYVGSDIDLPKFEGDKDNVKVDKGDLQGTWKFDGWYKSTDTTFTNKLTDAKVSANDAENKLVGKWVLTETATKEVTRVFVIDNDIMGDGKDVPAGHALPQGVTKQKPNDTENYIGSKQTPGKDKFKEVEETIGEKIGNWKFVKWDPKDLIVKENPGANDNKFTGTWTWTQLTSEKPTVDQPKAEDTVIKGKGKKGSKIVVTTPDGKTHETTVKDNGDWSVTVPPVKEGDKIKVTQEEKGKKKSGEVEVTVERKITYFGHFYEPSPDYLNKNVPAKKEEKAQEKYLELYRWYVKGNDMGMFMPKKGITRAEVAQMFARALEYDKAMVNVNITPYTDVDANAWYYEAVQKTSAAGIFKGSDKGTFMPTREITKAELIATIARFQHLSTKAGNTMNLQANHWATAEVEAAYQEGWLDIYTNGTAQFAADEVITRAEVVTILNRAFGRIADTKYIDDNAHTMTNFADVTKDMWSYYEIMTAANTYLVDKMWVNHATKDNGPETLKDSIEWVRPLIDNKDVREVVEQVRFQR